MSTKTRTLTRRPTTSCYELSITVLRALDLPAADVGGTSDPYCKLLFTNERIGKTKAINYTLNPEWNETFILTIPTQLSTLSPLSTVTVEIWDKDSLSADDLLGSVRLFLPRTSNVEKGWHNLIRPSGGEESNGSVLLSCQWMGMTPPMNIQTRVQLMRDACPPSLPAHSQLYHSIGPINVPPIDEAILASLEEVSLYSPYDGTLFVTDCRIVFVPYIANETHINDPNDYRHLAMHIFYPTIFNVSTDTVGAKSTLTFVLKNDRTYTFALISIGRNSNENGGSIGRNYASSDARNSSDSITSGNSGSIKTKGRGSVLNNIRDLGNMVGGSRKGGSRRSSSNWDSGINTTKGNISFEKLKCEIQWRCEEGCTAFSICQNYIQEHRTLGGEYSITSVTLNKNNKSKEETNTQNNATISHTNATRETKINSNPSNHSNPSNQSNLYTATSQNRRRTQTIEKHGIPNAELSRITGSALFYDEMQRLYTGSDCASKWNYIQDNWNYALCPTYSRHVLLPSLFPLSKLDNAASYRSKRRLPALTWINPNNNAPLCRCAQPRSGFTQMASMPEDDEMLLAIRSTAITVKRPNPILHIFDARPKLNANANALAGKGFENVNRLGGASVAKIMFCGIANIHVMRNSLNGLMRACEAKNRCTGKKTSLGGSMLSFHEQVGNSKWLEHVALLLRSSSIIADTLQDGQPCVVHCSDGWDRTSQLSALSQLMLDPYYTTINGFKALVEKDFCGFGHKFRDRIGIYSSNNSAQNERSPIFIQFLDAVYQMMYQKPTSFEFDEELLLFLSECAYNGVYGTFLSNCEKERVEQGYATDTITCWEYINQHKIQFINPLYNNSKENQNVIKNEIHQEMNNKANNPTNNEINNNEINNNELTNEIETEGNAKVNQESNEDKKKQKIAVLSSVIHDPAVDEEGDVIANGLNNTVSKVTKGVFVPTVRLTTRRLKIDGDSSSMVLWTRYYLKQSIHRITPIMLMKAELIQTRQIISDIENFTTEVSLGIQQTRRTTPSDSVTSTRSEQDDLDIQNHCLVVNERRKGEDFTNIIFNPSQKISSVLDEPSEIPMEGAPEQLILSTQSVFNCNVKKVSIIRDDKGGRFAAYLVRVSQSSPISATCAFHRRFSDFVWLEEMFIKFKVNNFIKLPKKDFFRWYGHEYLEERRTRLNQWVEQLNGMAEKFVEVRKMIYIFLDSSLQAGIKDVLEEYYL